MAKIVNLHIFLNLAEFVLQNCSSAGLAVDFAVPRSRKNIPELVLVLSVFIYRRGLARSDIEVGLPTQEQMDRESARERSS